MYKPRIELNPFTCVENHVKSIAYLWIKTKSRFHVFIDLGCGSDQQNSHKNSNSHKGCLFCVNFIGDVPFSSLVPLVQTFEVSHVTPFKIFYFISFITFTTAYTCELFHRKLLIFVVVVTRFWFNLYTFARTMHRFI